MGTDVYEMVVEKGSGEKVPLKAFEGKTLMVVNTASRCAFTSQYEELQEIYSKYKDRGLVVLGFPCNQFGNQEPGPNQQIQEFCSLNYNINFPIMAKVDVKGRDAHPLFAYLTSKLPGIFGTKTIKWNFTKFLIDKHGKPVKRFAPQVKPSEVEAEIVRLLDS